MKSTSKTDSRLKEFFVAQLKDMYWAEKKLVKTLPKLANAATSAELREAFSQHLTQTEQHVTRLEEVFRAVQETPETTKCPAMAGITDEGADIIDETEDGTAQRDVGLIFAGQKAEHYEIATYGGLVQLAKTLGYKAAVPLLKETLSEEKAADETLTRIAENSANVRASREPISA